MKRQQFVRLLVVAGLILIALIPFSLFIRGFRTPVDDAVYADAIVVLTGGAGRIEEGLRLFSEGKGRYLILSGVEAGSGLNAIFSGRDLRAMVDTSRIMLDIKSKSTTGNAINVKGIVEEKGFRSLILVTSNYHMRRAFSILRLAIKEDVEIYRHPVTGPNFAADEWWRDRNSLRLVTEEFFKYIWFHIWQRWGEL